MAPVRLILLCDLREAVLQHGHPVERGRQIVGFGIGTGLCELRHEIGKHIALDLASRKTRPRRKSFHDDPEVAAKDFAAADVHARTIDSNLALWVLSLRRQKVDILQSRRQLVWKARERMQSHVQGVIRFVLW